MAEVTENADGTITAIGDDGVRIDTSTDAAEDLAAAMGIEVTQQPSDGETPEEELAEQEPPQQSEGDARASEAPVQEDREAPTGNDDSDDDDDDTEDTEDRGSARRRRPGRRGRRMRRMQEQYEAERARDREEMAALRAQVETLTLLQGGGEEPDADAPLSPYDYDTQEDYIKALVERQTQEQVRAELASRDEQQRRDTAQSEDQRLMANFNRSLDAAWDAHEDFEDVVVPFEQMASEALRGAIVTADNPGELVYHLGSNPDTFVRLNTMGAVSVARELGKLEAQLEGTAPAFPPAGSRPPRGNGPPAPITPVNSGGGGNTDDRDPNEMTQDEYEAWYEKRFGRR